MRLDGRPQTYEVDWMLGDSLVITLRFRTSQQRPVSKAGSSWLGQLRLTPASVSVVATMTFDTSEETTGIIRGIVASSVTETLDPTIEYVWEIEEIDINGLKRSRAKGTVQFEQDTARV